GIGIEESNITGGIEDIALNMEAKSIRIEAPIPGKRAVGIEIENEKSNAVTIREIIESDNFKEAQSKITFALGRDIGGRAVVADLAAMPHLLIAGSTGSGKSVFVNSIITSILYKAHPEEVKLVLIDPKIVELSNYNGIPHLLIPVVTDAAKAAAALNWAVAEMDDRYKKFAETGVRDFASYNKLKAKEKNKVRNGEIDGPIPQIVIIIDELADLMMVSSSQVEESICRLAQKARAAGMHLIVATQRPSANVVTGLIKANIPSRIAFAVTSNIDSRIILDMNGAERLVGKGDMLFSPIGSSKPTRIQGTFISDEEVNKLIGFVREQAEVDEAAEADVLDTIERVNSPASAGNSADMGDELLPEAIELVVGAGNASVSMLQRRFRIGYNRAARIIDMMEERQIVGPPDGSRPRQVLISMEDLENMKSDTDE
ncbi:MAG: DNA translocase FtsK, partial [Firmicutes bacterium]|nr:DNA translocase FtsK [Bacillota bacterium]